MFIRKLSPSYYTGSQQHSGRGEYLALFSWNKYEAGDGWPEGPKYSNGQNKLWACIRQCSLHQLGHFMMGSIRIGGKSITVSGAIGNDGLPLDYQEVPEKYRYLLVEVPEEVAAVYWKDDGHNTIGSARDVLARWASIQFK